MKKILDDYEFIITFDCIDKIVKFNLFTDDYDFDIENLVEWRNMLDNKLLIMFKSYYIIFDYKNRGKIIYGNIFDLEYFKSNNLIFYENNILLFERNLQFGLDITNVLFLNNDIIIIYDKFLDQTRIYESKIRKRENILNDEYYIHKFGKLLFEFKTNVKINIC